MKKELKEFLKRGEVTIDPRFEDEFCEVLDEQGCNYYIDYDRNGCIFVNED